MSVFDPIEPIVPAHSTAQDADRGVHAMADKAALEQAAERRARAVAKRRKRDWQAALKAALPPGTPGEEEPSGSGHLDITL